MTDIPDAAVKAAMDARYDHGSNPQPGSPNRCLCGRNFPTRNGQVEHATRKELEAAFKYLQEAS
jgi:hypothetical protein